MGVIEVDSDTCWPLDEKEIELGVSKTLVDTTDMEGGPQTTEQGNEDAREEEHEWESTMMESLLNKHRPGTSWMKKRRRNVPRERINAGRRWSTIENDWLSLDRPTSVYWKTADNAAQTSVLEVLRKTLAISNQIEPSLHNK